MILSYKYPLKQARYFKNKLAFLLHLSYICEASSFGTCRLGAFIPALTVLKNQEETRETLLSQVSLKSFLQYSFLIQTSSAPFSLSISQKIFSPFGTTLLTSTLDLAVLVGTTYLNIFSCFLFPGSFSWMYYVSDVGNDDHPHQKGFHQNLTEMHLLNYLNGCHFHGPYYFYK